MRDNIRYNYYFVAFIDVLGQKELFQTLEGQTLTDDDPKLIEVHKKTVMFVESLRRGFQSFFDAYTAEGEPSVQIDPSKKEQFKAMMKSNLKHQRFSDCIQAYTSLRTGTYHTNVLNGVLGILLACGSLLLLSLSLKKAFRAGIEVGIGTELDNGEIYGPALYRAYELENKVAQYPRIVIGQELMDYLVSVVKNDTPLPQQSKEDIALCRALAERCLKLIVRDLDGVLILDYLGKDFICNINVHEDQAVEKTYKESFENAFQFIESEYAKKRNSGDSKLALRYYLLLNYFKARMPLISSQ